MDTVLIILIVCATITLNTYLTTGKPIIKKAPVAVQEPDDYSEEYEKELKESREAHEKTMKALQKMSTMTIQDQMDALKRRRNKEE